MVAGGFIGVATGITAWRSMRWTLSGRFELGLLVIGPAALAAFALALLLDGPVEALTVPTAAILVGFLVAFTSGNHGGGDEPDDEPPWWPSFERDLQRYERSRVR